MVLFNLKRERLIMISQQKAESRKDLRSHFDVQGAAVMYQVDRLSNDFARLTCK